MGRSWFAAKQELETTWKLSYLAHSKKTRRNKLCLPGYPRKEMMSVLPKKTIAGDLQCCLAASWLRRFGVPCVVSYGILL